MRIPKCAPPPSWTLVAGLSLAANGGCALLYDYEEQGSGAGSTTSLANSTGSGAAASTDAVSASLASVSHASQTAQVSASATTGGNFCGNGIVDPPEEICDGASDVCAACTCSTAGKPNWRPYFDNGHCYYFDTAGAWAKSEAEQACSATFEAKLVKLDDVAERDKFDAILEAWPNRLSFHTSAEQNDGADSPQVGWTWKDWGGEVAPEVWDEPANDGDGQENQTEQCGVLVNEDGARGFRDRPCNQRHSAMCEQ